MTAHLPIIVLSAAVFAGSLVSAFSGFAFSAIAGAILLHAFPPSEAVPLMMACSTVVQGANLFCLRRIIEWRRSIPLILGGLFGIPPALYLLLHADAATFRVGFGIFLALYSVYMFARPKILAVGGGPLLHGTVGFAGGLVGGLTAMPGALPVIWCNMTGLPKDQQRGLVQPFIAAMQIYALVVLFVWGNFSTESLKQLAIGLPALAAGTALGIMLFGKIDDASFRRIVLMVLFASALVLIF
jgi:uncharacterized protein